MVYIVTLVTDPAKLPLNEQIINKAFMALEKHDAQVVDIKWLAKDRACDIYFEHENYLNVSLAKLDQYEVDYAIITSENRRKKMLISDMDSTLINQECIDELADSLGIKPQVAAITEKAMNNELDFKTALKERVGLLKGLEEAALEQVYKNKITLMPGAKQLVATMKKHGAYCLLVSGGFTFFTEKVTKVLGFDEQHANNLEFVYGKLTGQVVEPILDKESKLASLKTVSARLGLTSKDVLAVGDGANDLPMILAASMGVAYHAKPNVQSQVRLKINHTNLRSLLYLQGYNDSEIVG